MIRCPKCASNDLRFMPPGNDLECQWCGHTFPKDHQKIATYETPTKGGAECPYCGFKNPRVISTRPESHGSRIRYHKCKCGQNFTSIEITRKNSA